MYAALERYAVREGHSSPRYLHKEDGLRIGTWVGTQCRKKDALPLDQRDKLESLPGWVWSFKTVENDR